MQQAKGRERMNHKSWRHKLLRGYGLSSQKVILPNVYIEVCKVLPSVGIGALSAGESEGRSSIIAGEKVVGFEGDVLKQNDAKRVVESTSNHYGRLDILVNVVAGNFLAPAEDLSPNGFRTIIVIKMMMSPKKFGRKKFHQWSNWSMPVNTGQR